MATYLVLLTIQKPSLTHATDNSTEMSPGANNSTTILHATNNPIAIPCATNNSTTSNSMIWITSLVVSTELSGKTPYKQASIDMVIESRSLDRLTVMMLAPPPLEWPEV